MLTFSLSCYRKWPLYAAVHCGGRQGPLLLFPRVLSDEGQSHMWRWGIPLSDRVASVTRLSVIGSIHKSLVYPSSYCSPVGLTNVLYTSTLCHKQTHVHTCTPIQTNLTNNNKTNLLFVWGCRLFLLIGCGHSWRRKIQVLRHLTMHCLIGLQFPTSRFYGLKHDWSIANYFISTIAAIINTSFTSMGSGLPSVSSYTLPSTSNPSRSFPLATPTRFTMPRFSCQYGR